MSKLLSRSTFQRDLAVRATEAERARIAGDIHDYALQDLTMLVRRLDAAGDAANAAAARDVRRAPSIHLRRLEAAGSRRPGGWPGDRMAVPAI